MKLHFLGTGAGLPSKYRNTQSFVFDFMNELKECWMFDCGEATQHKLMHTTLKPGKITRIFISHLHGDHILGLIGFLSSRNFLLTKDSEPITIYGPKGIKDYVQFNLDIMHTTLMYELNFVEFDEDTIIYDNDRVSVEIFSLEHTLTSYGFKIKFKDSKGELLVNKLLELGIKPGPFYKEIKENETFEYEGEVYNSADYLGTSKKGKIIAIIPDTMYFEELCNFISDADILVTECTYLKEEELDLATKHKHLNIININNFSKIKKFDKIYLTHISSRYDKAELINIKNNINIDNLFIAEDLDEFEL